MAGFHARKSSPGYQEMMVYLLIVALLHSLMVALGSIIAINYQLRNTGTRSSPHWSCPKFSFSPAKQDGASRWTVTLL
jgi:hypothetical protein